MKFGANIKRIVDVITFTLPAGLCQFDWNGNGSNYYFEFCLLSLYNWDKNFPSIGDLTMSVISYIIVISFVPCLVFLLIERKKQKHK